MTGQKPKPAKQDESKPESNESEPTKEKRMTISGGVPHPVDRSFYDPKQDCVIDVIRIDRSVQNKRGDWIDVVLYRHQYCKDEEIQAKYRRKSSAVVDVEVAIDG